MTRNKSLLILGDSASAPTGCVFENWVDMWAARARYDAQLVIDNASAVGMTLADAVAHLKALGGGPDKGEKPKAVLVFTGNCDVCGFGFHKTRGLMGGASGAMRRHEKYTASAPLSRRHKPFMFRDAVITGRLERCLPDKDCAGFVNDLAKAARKQGLPVVLALPGSKADFPPCNNIANFFAYRLAHLPARLPLRHEGDAGDLEQALALHDAGQTEQAREVYARLAGQDGEAAHIAANNIAALDAEAGDAESALRILEGFPRDSAMHPLALYHRAVILAREGREDQARELFDAAREEDKGSYRATRARNRIVAEAAARHDNLVVVDVGAALDDSDFVDYCHPDRGGQEKTLDLLRPALEDALGLAPGEDIPTQSYRPLNPDLHVGRTDEFFAHFGLTAPPDPDLCAHVVALSKTADYASVLADGAGIQVSPRDRTATAILSHPLMGDAGFLARSHPRTRLDLGRLPELFFIRHMLPLYEMLGSDQSLQEDLDGLKDLWPSHHKIMTWWPSLSARAFTADPHRLADMAPGLDFEGVRSRCRELLRFHCLSVEPGVFSRQRTLSYLFFRESCIFGTASDHSLLFRRTDLLGVLDACLFALALGGAEVRRGFLDTADLAARVLDVHRRRLAPLAKRPFMARAGDVAAYAEELRALFAQGETS